jgi:hypothetical protein
MANESTEHAGAPPLPAGTVMRPAGTMTPIEIEPAVHTRYVIDLPPEAAVELRQLMAETGDNFKELFQKALGLYKVTKKAIKEGKAVGIAENEESLETKFVGL